jgi:hypothetical protein
MRFPQPLTAALGHMKLRPFRLAVIIAGVHFALTVAIAAVDFHLYVDAVVDAGARSTPSISPGLRLLHTLTRGLTFPVRTAINYFGYRFGESSLEAWVMFLANSIAVGIVIFAALLCLQRVVGDKRHVA